jgi:hypothetical protein
MYKAQQLTNRLGHLSSTFITRATTLGNADLRPKLFLIKTQTATDLARIQYSIKEFHENLLPFYKELIGTPMHVIQLHILGPFMQ